jgi:hypothetical protein
VGAPKALAAKLLTCPARGPDSVVTTCVVSTEFPGSPRVCQFVMLRRILSAGVPTPDRLTRLAPSYSKRVMRWLLLVRAVSR